MVVRQPGARGLVALAAILLFSAACKAEVVTRVVTPTSAPTTSASATSVPSPTPNADAGLGDTLQTKSGDTLTVYSMRRNVPGVRFSGPKAGTEWVAFDVEGCAGRGGASFSMNPFYYSLRLVDNTEAKQSFGGQEPALHSENDIIPGDCLRGWVTFEVSDGARLESLRFNNFSLKAKWVIK